MFAGFINFFLIITGIILCFSFSGLFKFAKWEYYHGIFDWRFHLSCIRETIGVVFRYVIIFSKTSI